jgi:hypothetical protein
MSDNKESKPLKPFNECSGWDEYAMQDYVAPEYIEGQFKDVAFEDLFLNEPKQPNQNEHN